MQLMDHCEKQDAELDELWPAPVGLSLCTCCSNICMLVSQVRVFTYLIGREVSFAQNVKWIACNNKGKPSFHLPVSGCYFVMPAPVT